MEERQFIQLGLAEGERLLSSVWNCLRLLTDLAVHCGP